MEYTQTEEGIYINSEYEGDYIVGDFEFKEVEEENLDGAGLHIYKYYNDEYGVSALFKVFQTREMIEENILEFIEFQRD